MRRFYANSAAVCTAGAMVLGASSGAAALEGTRCSQRNRAIMDIDNNKDSKVSFARVVATSRFFWQ